MGNDHGATEERPLHEYQSTVHTREKDGEEYLLFISPDDIWHGVKKSDIDRYSNQYIAFTFDKGIFLDGPSYYAFYPGVGGPTSIDFKELTQREVSRKERYHGAMQYPMYVEDANGVEVEVSSEDEDQYQYVEIIFIPIEKWEGPQPTDEQEDS